MTKAIAAFVFQLGGLIIVGVNSNWWVASGLFLLVWGNNIHISSWVIEVLQELFSDDKNVT